MKINGLASSEVKILLLLKIFAKFMYTQQQNFFPSSRFLTSANTHTHHTLTSW